MTEKKFFDDIDLLLIFNKVNLKEIIAFIFVVETKSSFRASCILRCSQPSISLYLKHIRNVIDRPLFTHEGRRLLPTEYAVALCEKLKDCLIMLHMAIKGEAP